MLNFEYALRHLPMPLLRRLVRWPSRYWLDGKDAIHAFWLYGKG